MGLNTIKSMDLCCQHVVNKLKETKQFWDVQSLLKLNSVSPAEEGLATQFIVGRNYWSGVHTNQDYFFTFLSCLVANPYNVDEVMYYFFYPEYKVAIPMKSTELILFNPTKMYCCSNCKYTDS